MGKIDCRPLAWKAATRIDPGSASLTKALRTAGRDRTDEEVGLWTAGELLVDVVARVRFDAAARQVRLSIAGRTIEAMMNCYNRPFCGNRLIVIVMKLEMSSTISRNNSLGKNRAYVKLSG